MVSELSWAHTGLVYVDSPGGDPRNHTLFSAVSGLKMGSTSAAHMLGIPGGDVVYCYPDVNCSVKEANAQFQSVERNVAHPSGSIHYRDVNTEILVFNDGRGFENYFEACFKIRVNAITRYYLGGCKGYSTTTALDVLKAVIVTTEWDYTLDLFGGGTEDFTCEDPGPAPEFVWPSPD